MPADRPCPDASAWWELLHGQTLPEWSDAHLEQCPGCRAVVEDLSTGDPAWLAMAAELRQPRPDVPPVFQRVLDNLTRAEEPADAGKGAPMTACLHIERMMHRTSMAVPGESAACYALLKLIPAGLNGARRPVGLNLALVVDLSGSMYDEDGTGQSRLARIQQAIRAALAGLQPTDTLAIVGFGYNARVLLPATAVAERARIDAVIAGLDRVDVDPGGTALDEGLALALAAIESQASPGKLSQLVVLTDGETSGEENCRRLARQAADKKIHLTLMGVGLDWKAALIKDLAKLSDGKWYYIDASEQESAARIFAREFDELGSTAFLDVQLQLRPVKDVRIKRLRQVLPEIKELALEDAGTRELVARLGAVGGETPRRYIVEMSLPRRPDGKYVVVQLELTYLLDGERKSSGGLPLEMAYTAAGNGYANAEVMRHIDDVLLKEMSDTLQDKLNANDMDGARRAAEGIEKKASLMGKRAIKKTQLAQNVLQELNAGGRVSRTTQLCFDDEARRAELP